MKKFKKKKVITPLSKFPTEALLMMFRKHRHCETDFPWEMREHRRFNYESGKYEYWVPVWGDWFDEKDGKTYRAIVRYDLHSSNEIVKDYTTTYGNEGFWSDMDVWYGKIYWEQNIHFQFEGMYWRGTIGDIRKELARRPHVNLKGSRDFRKWKIEYKKSLKNH